eukprot:TRINITY_DN183_c0_g2_i1.p1 TRINITY_DN183_c0_g2~~TRINITY_DN183_c0_g2_i1.p1  ORF type:complete len:246 (+),score=37.24 TRINITY_DN183_c0_g2_i1:39-776(+)
MGYLRFFGCMFVALAPSLALFIQVTLKRPVWVVLAIGSSFFWLLAVLLSSVIWYIISPLRSSGIFAVLISVPLQELSRWLFYKLYAKMDIKLSTRPTLFNQLCEYSSIGLGSGLIYVLVMYSPFLWTSRLQGALLTDHCPALNLFVFSAVNSFFFSIIHVQLTVMAMLAYKNNSLILSVVVGLLHMAASSITLMNGHVHCGASISLLLGFVIALFFVTGRTVQHYCRTPPPSDGGLFMNLQDSIM